MTFLLIFVVTVVVCALLRRSIKKHASAFYGIALALEVLYGLGCVMDLPEPLWRVLYLLMQQSTLSMALFFVVMYVGAVPPSSLFGRIFRPIRAELSILACLLTLGHMAVYLACLPRLMGPGRVTIGVLIGFIVAVVLMVLLALLGTTSITGVKRKLGSRRWRGVQKLAYVFYILTYVHLMLVLAPSVEHGVLGAIITAGVYTALYVVYGVLRLRYVLAQNPSFLFVIGHSKPLGREEDEAAHNAICGQ